MTAPDPAGTPDSRSGTVTAGQAPWQVARDAFWEAERGAVARTGDGWDWATVQDGRRGWEAVVQAITAAGAQTWEAWYAAESAGRTMTDDFNESKYDAMRRAFLGAIAAAAPAGQAETDPLDGAMVECGAPHCPPSMHTDCEWPKCATVITPQPQAAPGAGAP